MICANSTRAKLQNVESVQCRCGLPVPHMPHERGWRATVPVAAGFDWEKPPEFCAAFLQSNVLRAGRPRSVRFEPHALNLRLARTEPKPTHHNLRRVNPAR